LFVIEKKAWRIVNVDAEFENGRWDLYFNKTTCPFGEFFFGEISGPFEMNTNFFLNTRPIGFDGFREK